jgi:endonuclease/exonuclease/phosphatase (EEP) superfamily protein YafD
MPTTRFLFWNINRKPLAEAVAELAEAHAVDVVVLAESITEPGTLIQALNKFRTGGFQFPRGLSRYVAIFTRFSREFIQPIFESERVSIRKLSLPARSEVLIAAVHLPSKLHWSGDSQAFECAELARQIAAEEDRVGHQRTVLLGDFNMNPFEKGLVAANGLNSVMSRRTASRATRTVQGREYRFFYNPMWGHLGDLRGDTAGTYYYDSAEHVNYFWNVFDQIMLRPDLAAGFDGDKLKIVTTIGNRSLVRQDGRPDADHASDHLPILFELNF